MKIKLQIKSIFGDILFEYEKENNNIKDTLLEGIKQKANLSRANLSRANLSWANLSRANLPEKYKETLQYAQSRILPEGDLIGYKKCANGIIVKLKIPSKAKRSHAFGRKCRAEYAKVLAIYGADIAYSTHDKHFIYKKGNIVKPNKPFSDNWTQECESGIHFFITKIEAENYFDY